MQKTKTLAGFTLFETILYIALFSLMAVAVLQFAWNTLDLGTKGQSFRQVHSEARFVSMRLNNLIRESEGVNTVDSLLDDPAGKLVLEKLGSSDTVTIELQNSRITLTETGGESIPLQSLGTVTTELRFTMEGNSTDQSEYVGYNFLLQSEGNESKRNVYQAIARIFSGASIRNSGL